MMKLYIVVGRMGLFAGDWLSYGASQWMAGSSIIYPSFTALAYQVGGLIGSRLLNVFFGVILIEQVYRLVNLLNFFDERTNRKAALITSVLVGFSGIGIHVSKLATYDMPSFLFMIVGLNSFLKASYYQNGKYYFLSFLFLYFAFLTKIVIAIYFPLIFIFSIILLLQRGKEHLKIAVLYFYLPFLIAFGIYFGINSHNISTYVGTHKDLGKGSLDDILTLFWNMTNVPLLLASVSIVILILEKRITKTFSLILLALAIPIFHILLLRYATFDKHLYLTVIFLSIIAGYGMSVVLMSKVFNKLLLIYAPIFVLSYGLISYQVLYVREHNWVNSYQLQSQMDKITRPGDKVLTEEGGAVVLSLYDKIFPPNNIITFDWIDYLGKHDYLSYHRAVNDMYFDIIQLSNSQNERNELENVIRNSLDDGYILRYNTIHYQIYERKNR